MARRPFPHLGKMKRIIRAVQATGERMERLEVHGDDFVVVLAQKDAPESDVDLIQPAASVALYPNHAPRGKGSE